MAWQVFFNVLSNVTQQVCREEDFLSVVLQIQDQTTTFADYMDLESYFRRQASRFAGLGSATAKLLRGAMDLIFGFLAGELKTWADLALIKDPLCVLQHALVHATHQLIEPQTGCGYYGSPRALHSRRKRKRQFVPEQAASKAVSTFDRGVQPQRGTFCRWTGYCGVDH